MNLRTHAFTSAIALLATFAAADTMAEPYLAVRSGLKCSACHVSPTGGGMRDSFGARYAHTQLTANLLGLEEVNPAELTALTPRLSVGADLRASASARRLDSLDNDFQFERERVSAYVHVALVPGRVELYLDQKLAPGSAESRESWALFRPLGGSFYVRAGRFFLPYGWRLEDDTAFIRQATGINFTTSDDGVEVGAGPGKWAFNLAVTNGNGGGPEEGNGKQYSLRVEHVQSRWRLGASANLNDAFGPNRRMMNVFAGIKTGPVGWLVEFDRVDDAGVAEQNLLLAEGNWEIAKGHNLKYTFEFRDPDVDRGDDRFVRHSVVWEFMPVPFTQLRLGLRQRDGNEPGPLKDSTVGFLQLHLFL
ncbi:MAG: hypothetical protein V3U43_00985 [Pseudomonadales bacterium]